MPTNAQQYSGDFFRSSADFHESLFAQVSEEWAQRREREQEYNEWLQSRIDRMNDSIRQYATIGNTLEHREMGYRFSLAGLQQRFENSVTAAQARTVRAAIGGLDELREKMRKAMAGEAGHVVDVASLLRGPDNSLLTGEAARRSLVEGINQNSSVGRLLGAEWVAGEDIGQASRGTRIALGLGGVDTLLRLSASGERRLTTDEARAVMADVVGVDPQELDERALEGHRQLMTTQTISATANMPTQAEQLQWLENDSQFWGNTPEMRFAATQLARSEAERDELQTALDTRLEAQAGRNEEAEIEATMRDRAGRVGAGADLGGGIFGAIRRSRAQDRWDERQNRHRNLTEGQQILFGSFGEAEALTDQFGFNAPMEGQSWQIARDLMDQGSSGGWSSPEELVELAGGLSGGDQALRNEILRNVTYLKMSNNQGTALRTPEQQRQEEGLASRRLMWTDYFAERGQPIPEGFDLESMELPSVAIGLASRRLMWTDYFAARGQPVPEGFDLESMELPEVAIEMAARRPRAQDPNQEEVNYVPLSEQEPEAAAQPSGVTITESNERWGRTGIMGEDPSFLPDYVLASRATMMEPMEIEGTLPKPKPLRSGKPTRTAYDKVLSPSINTTKGR